MSGGQREKIRPRATAIVIREGRVLMVREPTDSVFHIPGGGVEQGELPISAVARELYEETGLVATEIEYLFGYYHHWGENGLHYIGMDHNVFRVKADGEIALGPEIQEYVWWDRATELPLIDWVEPILGRL